MKSKKRPGLLQLPPRFSDTILTTEMEVEASPSKERVLHLVNLYSVIVTQQAIEYYETVRDPKCTHFQSRLQSLLSQPEILLLINQPVSETTQVRKKIGKTLKHPPVTCKRPPMPAVRCSEQLLQSHDSNSTSGSLKVLENLKQQECKLATKLKNRKSKCANILKKIKPRPEFHHELEAILAKCRKKGEAVQDLLN